MTTLALRVARRGYRLLPDALRRRFLDTRTRLALQLHTAGLGPDPDAVAWFAAEGRPFSIVIPSYNDLPLLRAALRSVEETCAGMDYEVVIVDDYIDPGVQAQLQALRSERVRVVLKDERLGFAGTVNAGMAVARHDIVLLNSDIVALPGWIEALQHAAYAIDPAIGLVSAKLVYPDGRIQYAGTYYARLLAPQWFGHLHVGAPAGRPTANVAGYNTAASGACVYITRSAYETLEGLDEGFWLGFEDVDYGLRAWGRGIRCYYEPAAMLVHHESASRGYSQGHRELASMRRFWRRWQDRFLMRRLPDDYTVDFVITDEGSTLWREYVGELAADLAARGHETRVHDVDPSSRDANVARLKGRTGVVVACDHRVAEAVWLAAALGTPAPVYLVPTVESAAHPSDPAAQARIVAGYRSDFDFISPNRWTAQQLQAETAWESTARVAPALEPEDLPPEQADLLVTIGADPHVRAVVDALGAQWQLAVAHLDDIDTLQDLARLRDQRPRVVIDLREHANSAAPYALMALGAVYVSRRQPRCSHEVLDGYNALMFDADDESSLQRAVTDAATRDAVREELRTNAHQSVSRAAVTAREDFAHALDAIALSVL